MRYLAATMFAVALFAVAGCGEKAGKPSLPRPSLVEGRLVFPEGSQQLAAFVTEPVRAGAPLVVQLPGRIVWNEDRTVRLFPSFAGRVTAILAKPGDVIVSGQTLATMASPDFGQAQADARRASADFSLAEKNLVRLRELHAAGVAPMKDLIASEADFSRADNEMQRANSRVRLYGGALDSVNQTFALKSPIAGTVIERNINPGQELRTDLQLSSVPAMFVVTDPARLWVNLEATERDLPYLKRGQTMRLKTSAWPDLTFSANIEVISDFIDPATRTIRARGVVENRDRKLKGEMYVTAEFESASPAKVQVPSKAVFLFEDKHYVFVQTAPREYSRIEVKTSGEHGGMIGLLDGLQAGQRVVTDGNLFLLRIHRQLQTGAPV